MDTAMKNRILGGLWAPSSAMRWAFQWNYLTRRTPARSGDGHAWLWHPSSAAGDLVG